MGTANKMHEETKGELERVILKSLSRGGEWSTANLGNEWFAPNGGASNPGTLAAASVLRSLRRRGIVVSRVECGRDYMRTLWRLAKK